MMELKDILYKVPIIATSGSSTREVKHINSDSRDLKKNSLFIALKGNKYDGHKYIETAIKSGANVIVCDNIPKKVNKSITYIKVSNTKRSLSVIASNFYNNPSKKIKLIGITGTNGKTTISTLLYDVFNNQNQKAGLISTIYIKYGKNNFSSRNTTPDILKINYFLSEMVKENIKYCFMEVSSHGISQGRIDGLNFIGGVFTNLTRDHLDYHKSFKNYRNVKKQFFDLLPKNTFSLVNNDDKNASFMIQNTLSKKSTYAIKNYADFNLKVLESSFNGMLLKINNNETWTSLLGEFNASNLLAVYAVSVLMGLEKIETLKRISLLKNVPGRFQIFKSDSDCYVIIDYAHTPDALENIILAINQIRTQNEKLITVIGCGGERDMEKRYEMGRIASKESDNVIFTSDNPRHENPKTIIEQMMSGVKIQDKNKIICMEDREMAIKKSREISNKEDIILIAGKGHETYQEISNNKIPFDDFLIAKKYFKNKL
ncbi:MAG: UDP-N-acetylmuramoyl-L-alanyl-D-glutamate--2,6-diaminopimelate ligase [Flavobacteriales bacterium]|nr:UDP-N-acetylmuramoyl-L-alanyl-D-glutamate--2,6-diaminopimelate ligase [Flavobacteriales bacterium]